MLRLFRASNDAPPSPTLVCNYAGRVVVAQPGAKPEGANGAATGLRRAPCQKCLGLNDTCALFRLFTEVSTWQRTLLCHLPRESSKQTFVSKLNMKSTAPSGVCNELLLKLVSPCEWPKLDTLPACTQWSSLFLIQPFCLCNVL